MAKKKSTRYIIILIIIAVFLVDKYFLDSQIQKKLTEIVREFEEKDKRDKKQVDKEIKPPKKIDTPAYEDIKGDFYQLYFSQVYEGDPKIAKQNNNSIDKKLAAILVEAKTYIYAAVHELDNDVITDALLHAHNNGVDVKIVTEDHYINEESVKRLRKVGVPIIDDSKYSSGRLMHNKFFVIDGEKVWTGSLNPTTRGCYYNNNNGILINSKKIAENFFNEFNEMFKNKDFGIRSDKTIVYPTVEFADGTIIQTLFAPENDVASVLLEELDTAKKSIYFMAFSFTHDKMGMKMIDKHQNGVLVKGIFESQQNKTSQYSEYKKMKKLGLDVILDNNKYNMHHKVIVIDEETTITGSFNFSKNANKKNDENVLIIKNPVIAKAFIEEFNRLYGGVQ